MIAWEEIIFHHSAGKDGEILDAARIRKQHTTTPPGGGPPWLDIGYHFVVERAGIYLEPEVIVGRPLNMAGAHCPGHNLTAIGICFVGDFSSAPPPPALLAVAAKRIVRPLMEQFEIPRTRLHLHREFRATECPGAMFTQALVEQWFG